MDAFDGVFDVGRKDAEGAEMVIRCRYPAKGCEDDSGCGNKMGLVAVEHALHQTVYTCQCINEHRQKLTGKNSRSRSRDAGRFPRWFDGRTISIATNPSPACRGSPTQLALSRPLPLPFWPRRRSLRPQTSTRIFRDLGPYYRHLFESSSAHNRQRGPPPPKYRLPEVSSLLVPWVPSFGPRMVCTKCGTMGAAVPEPRRGDGEAGGAQGPQSTCGA
jgi:hypothetical protein